MKMPLQDSGELQEHSEAKVRLLSAYLQKYLSVVTNGSWFRFIEIYDLFCGPGVYGAGSEGSPLIALKRAEEIFLTLQSKGKDCPRINLTFADKTPDNILSVRRALGDRKYNINGTVNVEVREFRESFDILLSTPTDRTRKEFVFIDPTGYSDVRCTDIRDLVRRDAEVLLFLPIQFMSRFRANAMPGSLEEFATELSGIDRLAKTKNAHDYAVELRELFRSYLGSSVFVSTFMIEKDPATLYCLYFFTPKLQGHLKMIEARWEVGVDAGHGWTFRTRADQSSLFGSQAYVESVVDRILENGGISNIEMFEKAVIEYEIKPSLVTAACKSLAKQGRIQTVGVESKLAKRGYFYIGSDYYINRDDRVIISRV